MDRQANLFEIILTMRSPSSLARLLYSWQQQRDENGDNCDNDQQFDQCKAVLASWSGIEFQEGVPLLIKFKKKIIQCRGRREKIAYSPADEEKSRPVMARSRNP